MAEVAEVAPEVAGRGALMESLNAVKLNLGFCPNQLASTIAIISMHQGLEVTAKLKKVSDDEKTHKNPALRGDGLVNIIIIIMTMIMIIIIIIVMIVVKSIVTIVMIFIIIMIDDH